jgi:hypothetical protein
LLTLVAACGPKDLSCSWVVDEAGDALIALDAELYRIDVVSLPRPHRLALGGKAMWVATQGEAGSKLVCLARGTRGELACGGIRALDADADGVVTWLEDGGMSTHLWRAGTSLERTLLGAFKGARALATSAIGVLVGTSEALVLVRGDGAWLATRPLTAPALELDRGPRPGEWWSLQEDGALALIDAALVTQWEVAVGPEVTSLAAVPGEERAWVVCASGLRLYGARGSLEHELELPPGPWAAAAARARTVWIMGPGAVLAVELRGARPSIRRTQGGFERLRGLELEP